MLRCGKPPANGKPWRAREGGRRIQLKKYDITCAKERGSERGAGERMGGGTVRVRASGETALDGLAAEQMWVRKGWMEKKGRAEREKREHLY